MEKAKKILALALAAVLFLSNINPLYARADDSETTSVSSETTAPVTVEATESRDPAETSPAATVTEPAGTTVPAAADEPEPSQVETAETTAPTEEHAAPNGDASEPNGDDPAGETTASVGETTVPTGETAAPIEETTAPTEETAVPTGETTVPTEETSAPTEETTIPTEETVSPEENQSRLVEELESAIGALPNMPEFADAPENYPGVKAQLEQVDALLRELAAFLEENGDPLSLLSEDARAHYQEFQAFLSVLEQVSTLEGKTWQEELADIEKRIFDLPKAESDSRLGKDAYIALRDQLALITLNLDTLKKNYPGDVIALSGSAQEAYNNALKTLALGPAAPDLTLLPGLDASFNQKNVTLQFQWNDHRNGERPPLPEFGYGIPGQEDAGLTVMVSIDGKEDLISLYEFYQQLLGDRYGYNDSDTQLFVNNMKATPSSDLEDNVHGSHVDLTWNADQLLTGYKDADGTPHTVSYRLIPAVEKLTGNTTYLLTQGDPASDPSVDPATVLSTVLATPTRDFHYNVVWYDNHDRYVDDNGHTARPDFTPYIKSNTNTDGKELDGYLQVIQVEDDENTTNRILDNSAFHPECHTVPNTMDGMGDTWEVSLTDLPLYSPAGNPFRYWVRQTRRDDGNVLNTTLSTGAYYTQEIINNDLVDVDYPNAITDGSTVYNILSRQGKIEITKKWEGGSAATRPNATLHFYREVEPDVVTTDENGNIVFNGFDGSPVAGYDSWAVDKTQDEVTITIPAEQDAYLPMFDPYGHRYIYYCVETMANAGDYEAEIDNSKGGPVVLPNDELAAVREGASDPNVNIILNGSTITNRLKKQIRIPVEVDFKAQAIQNEMDFTSVELQLQYKNADGKWVNYDLTEGYDGKLTLDFAPEIMTVEGKSEPVNKYDENGDPYEYRWVQTKIHVSGGTSGELSGMPDSWADPDEVKKIQERVPVRKETPEADPNDREVGPGIGGDNTTLLFDVTSTNPKKEETQVITNILVGDTQVEARKTWTYTVNNPDGTTTTYCTDDRPGTVKWDGSPIPGVVGVTWPSEIALTFYVRRNAVPLKDENGDPVTLTMGQGIYIADLDHLPRYDENGNEYSYTLTEANSEGGWGSNWEHSASVVYFGNEYILQKATAFENAIGPGSSLSFEVTKHWLDDTDLKTRRPVEVGVFRLDSGKLIESATLDTDKNYNVLITIPKQSPDDTVANYVLKEISMSGVPVTDDGNLQGIKEKALNFFQVGGSSREYFIAHRHDAPETFFDGYRAGTLGKHDRDVDARLEFQYNIYLSAEDRSETFSDYHLFNQRTAVMTVTLNKIWINDGQLSTATFHLNRLQDGYRDDEYRVQTLTASVGADGKNTATCSFTDLPKYDATGVLYEYEVEERSMTVDGKGEEAFFDTDGVAMVTGVGRSYRYLSSTTLQDIKLAQSEWLKDPDGKISPHHSGDVYTWQSTNTRQNTKAITIHKVWRDGAGPQNTQDSVTRPDISFHLYRISHAALRELQAASTPAKSADYVTWMIDSGKFGSEDAASKVPGVQRVNGNVFWSTSYDTQETNTPRQTNNWHWECNISQSVPLFDNDGSPYVYFVYEYMRGNAYGYEPHYDNTSGDLDRLYGNAGTTEKTFAPLPKSTASPAAGEAIPTFEDSPFLVAVDGENANDYYPCIVVNTRHREATITGEKTWNFGKSDLFLGEGGIPYEKMPALTLKLWRDVAEMWDDDHDGNYEFVPAKWNLATQVDTQKIEGSTDTKYAYAFAGYPRYDEYGYRYSYWLTEDKIPGYESDRTLLEKDETGRPGITPPSGENEPSSYDSNRGSFDITNTYTVQPPYVTVSLAKSWNWPEKIINAKKNLTATFELYGVIMDESGNQLGTDQLFAKKSLTIQVQEDGTLYYVNDEGVLVPYPADNSPILTFTKSNAGNFAGKYLPYYAPNGRPFHWYIKETANGYAVKDISTNPVSRAVTRLFNWLRGTKAVTEPNSSNLAQPTEDAAGNLTAAVTLKNTYDGGGTNHPLNIQKKWEDKYLGSGSEMADLRPDKIQVKLYRQWSVGNGTWAWEQVTKADEDDSAAGWEQMTDGVLTLTPPADDSTSSVWTLKNPLTGLYRYAPNGKLYEYFVVEQDPTGMLYHSALSPDTHPDVGSAGSGDPLNITNAMAKRSGYSGSITLSAEDATANIPLTNKLLTKTLTVNKKWQKQLQGETTVSELTAEDAKELNVMGGLPQSVHFFVQYSLDDTNWYYMPAGLDAFKRTDTADWDTVKSSIGSYQHVTVTMAEYINNDMDVPKTVSGLPAYRKSTGGREEIFYRFVEAKQNADGTLTLVVDTPDSTETSTGSQPVVKTVSQTFTNTVTAHPLILRKVWKGDHANRDDTRPPKITLTVTDTVTGKRFQVDLTQRDNVDGYVYESVHYVPEGQNIAELAVTESDVSGYGYENTSIVPSEKDNAFVFTATNTLKDHERAVISLTAKKNWSSEPALDAAWINSTIRPKIKFTLQYRYWDSEQNDWTPWENADKTSTGVEAGDVTKEVTADAGGNYSVTWENVFKYHDEDNTAIARPIQYKIVETMESVTGTPPYTASVGAFGTANTATVTNTLKTVQPTVTKLWKWQDGENSGSLTAGQLKKLIDMKVLPTHIRFAVYYKSGSSDWRQVPNAFIDLSVKGDLLDTTYQPRECTVKNKFPRYDKTGAEISYELREFGIFYGNPDSASMIPVTDGAVGSFTVADPVNGNGTVTNTLPVGSLTVTKKWDDRDNRDGIRPNEITVTLLRDGAAYDTVTIKADKDGNWAYTWKDLPVYQTVTAPGTPPEESKYTVQEVFQKNGKHLLEGYDPTADGAAVTVSGLTLVDPDPIAELVNVHVPVTMSVSAQKKWDDQDNFYSLRPDSVQFKLQYKDGDNWIDVPYDADGLGGTHDAFFTGISLQYPGAGSTSGSQNENGAVTLEEKNGAWPVITWTGLPAYANGREIEYTVTEVDARSCYRQESGTVTYSALNTVELVNSLITTQITVRKNWENDQGNRYGTRPDSLTFKLQSSIDGGDWTDVLNEDGNPRTATMTAPLWKDVSFDKLPVRDGENHIFHYRVEEITTVPGYTSPDQYRSPEHGIAEFTNELVTVDLSGSKTWDDADNQDGMRPKSITVCLYADGKALPGHTAEVTEKENWRWSFASLPKYRSDGTEAVYTVSEDPVEGYTPQYTGMDILNTHVPRKISVPVTKSWKDWNNVDRLRPSSVTVRLLADGNDTGKFLTLSEGNGWKGSFTDLDEFREGKQIRYTVTEDPVAKYKSSIQGDAQDGFTVVNSHTPSILPKTGDDPRLLIYLAVLLLSTGGLIGASVSLGKRKKKQ